MSPKIVEIRDRLINQNNDITEDEGKYIVLLVINL